MQLHKLLSLISDNFFTQYVVQTQFIDKFKYFAQASSVSTLNILYENSHQFSSIGNRIKLTFSDWKNAK